MNEDNRKVRKAAFILILILLLIFLPLTGYTIYLKATGQDKPKPKENTLKEFLFDGKLWFYNDVGVLLDTYTCDYPDAFCDYASDYNIDSLYEIQSYKNKEEETDEKDEDDEETTNNQVAAKTSLINNRYAFITDTADQNVQKVFLLDAQSHVSYKSAPYQNIKSYGVGIDGDLMIIQNMSNQYAVMELKDSPNFILPFEYSYIALQDERTEDGLIVADNFICNQEGKWYLVNKKNEKVTEGLDEAIVAFKSDAIITRDMNHLYHLMDYNGEKIIADADYLKLNFVGDYLAVTKALEFYLYDYHNDVMVGEAYPLTGQGVYTARENDDGKIEILYNDDVYETLDI